LDNIVATIALELKWTVNEIEELFYDNIDFKGAVFWYERISKIVQKLSNNK
jgi:hypothetical protein